MFGDGERKEMRHFLPSQGLAERANVATALHHHPDADFFSAGEPSSPRAPRLVAPNLLTDPENVQVDYRRCKVK